MKLSWLLNGTMQAHHLAAAYVIVWVIQGGYAVWAGFRLRALMRGADAGSGTVGSRR